MLNPPSCWLRKCYCTHVIIIICFKGHSWKEVQKIIWDCDRKLISANGRQIVISLQTILSNRIIQSNKKPEDIFHQATMNNQPTQSIVCYETDKTLKTFFYRNKITSIKNINIILFNSLHATKRESSSNFCPNPMGLHNVDLT